jgi:hypothetical protein
VRGGTHRSAISGDEGGSPVHDEPGGRLVRGCCKNTMLVRSFPTSLWKTYAAGPLPCDDGVCRSARTRETLRAVQARPRPGVARPLALSARAIMACVLNPRRCSRRMTRRASSARRAWRWTPRSGPRPDAWRCRRIRRIRSCALHRPRSGRMPSLLKRRGRMGIGDHPGGAKLVEQKARWAGA